MAAIFTDALESMTIDEPTINEMEEVGLQLRDGMW